MRAVVTGGTGFIGSHLVDALLARGDEVACVGRPGATRRWLVAAPVEFLTVGVNDVKQLTRAFEGADVVFHLAGCNHAPSRAELYALNTEGTACVARAAAALGTAAPHIIFASSVAAVGSCGDGERLTAESTPRPLSRYGRSKILAEAVIHAYADRIPATILRLPSVYGPRERGVYKFFRGIRRGFALTVGSWDREVSLIYIKDLVQGLLATAAVDRKAAAARIYYLTHPDPVTWETFARSVGQELGRQPILISVPEPLARVIARSAEGIATLRGRSASLNRERVHEIAQRRWVCDPSRAIDELGFRPQFPIARGVPETVAWYREAGWL